MCTTPQPSAEKISIELESAILAAKSAAFIVTHLLESAFNEPSKERDGYVTFILTQDERDALFHAAHHVEDIVRAMAAPLAGE